MLALEGVSSWPGGCFDASARGRGLPRITVKTASENLNGLQRPRSGATDRSLAMKRIWISTALLTGAMIAMAQSATAQSPEIRTFRVNVPEEDLVDLRRRITATKWPERELVNDATQGV